MLTNANGIKVTFTYDRSVQPNKFVELNSIEYIGEKTYDVKVKDGDKYGCDWLYIPFRLLGLEFDEPDDYEILLRKSDKRIFDAIKKYTIKHFDLLNLEENVIKESSEVTIKAYSDKDPTCEKYGSSYCKGCRGCH